jgi:hypothetical protein
VGRNRRGRWLKRKLRRAGRLTQYGRAFERHDSFAGRPEPGQTDLSVIRGRASIGKAAQLVAERALQPGDAVRHTTVGCLRDAGFTVEHTPREGGFPDHCSVKGPDVWDDEVERRFNECWDEIRRQEPLPH